MSTDLTTAIDDAVARAEFGRATAAKRGRNPKWAWVPIIDHGAQAVGINCTKTVQIKGRAFATRAEAVDCAQRQIDRARESLRADLAKRNMRALREHHGLPRELA